ncbi:hypothetical protein AB0E77_01165 [Streptomyces sp. NPDC032940]|uniref:hypothetical protein n=1 Tax=Streptomyces sp. NPDC032940 TaxID=3155366 RepID=UPI0033F38E0A
MARHVSPRTQHVRRVLVALATAGAALAAGAATASAGTRAATPAPVDPQAGVRAVTGNLGLVTGPFAGLERGLPGGAGALR